MSRTLFWYIFVDLMKIFMMASGALAGIMSFGGLLRPLTQQGLDAAQVGKMLTYLSPAMSAYSFPVAALFAATVVYGRLSADNEVIAARAGGISHLMIALPAVVMGLVVALISIVFLCFIVPTFTLKVERVIYSNLAQLVANQIERTHKAKLPDGAIFATHAEVVADTTPNEQCVILYNPMIASYEAAPDDKRLRVPAEFYLGDRATVYIHQDAEQDDVTLRVLLDGGVRFPRNGAGATEAGVKATTFGPIDFPSPIKEDVKFMVISDLKNLYTHPDRSRKISKLVDDLVTGDEAASFLRQVQQALLDPESAGKVTLRAADATYVLSAAGCQMTPNTKGQQILFATPAGNVSARLQLTQVTGNHVDWTAEATALRLAATAHPQAKRVALTIRMDDVTRRMGEPASASPRDDVASADDGSATQPAGDSADVIRQARFDRTFTVAMPADVAKLEDNRTRPAQYVKNAFGPNPPKGMTRPAPPANASIRALGRELLVLSCDIQAELNSRAAFAISCLVLVLVGCALGIMFKSGNFLTAFAVSFVPALLSITLIIAGQRTSQSVPAEYWKSAAPLQLGLTLIWAGNAAVGALAFGLLYRLQKQ